MPLDLFNTLKIPVIAAPMYQISSPDLVVSCARSGIIAAFPSLNPREPETLVDWLDEIESRCDAHDISRGKYGVNLVVHRTNSRLDAHKKIIVDKKVPFVVTSLGAADDVIKDIQSYGGVVLHDVISRRHAEKAIAAGVDGLVLVCAGAGGHGGTLNPFSFISEIREMFDGLIILAGGVSCGRGIAAACAAGADLVYMGTRFIPTLESKAEPEYRQMLIDSAASDIIYTKSVSGVNGNYLRQSIEDNNINLSAVREYRPAAIAFSA